ncbi:MAG: hypothetical protein M3P85_03150 [Actinomycetota bacterium]|nr:hypothetical protein [Actinomycetota bacterium]PLS75949.1 MAG: hypothetical protein CYG61_04590 [Actinomycetota bacterium]
MFKRLLWLTIGVGFGFGVSFWVVRLVREKVARYTPERVSADLAGAVRELSATVKAAVAEGAAAMREREAELRDSLNEPSRTGR